MNTNDTPTPRCDEEAKLARKHGATLFSPAFARQLERELNEAKIALQKCLDALTDGDTVEPCGYLPAIEAARAILKP